MENTMTTITTAKRPSRIAMPTRAAAFGTDVYGVDVCGIERDRVSVKGHLGLTQAFAPGPHAWSPPS